jgi:hypothetical protein
MDDYDPRDRAATSTQIAAAWVLCLGLLTLVAVIAAGPQHAEIAALGEPAAIARVPRAIDLHDQGWRIARPWSTGGTSPTRADRSFRPLVRSFPSAGLVPPDA